jgi:pimeloyl-ACP methyl ester carboxylesterase
MPASRRRRRLAAYACALVGLSLVFAPGASAHDQALKWKSCGLSDEAATTQCATATVPLDYDRPSGKQIQIAVGRVPAVDQKHRIGSLFFNFGGPGAPAVDYLQANGAGFMSALNQRFDIVGFDPRGVGASSPSIDCKVNQETQGVSSQPFTTPFNLDAGALIAKDQRYIRRCIALNGEILAHVSTADVARDLDRLRDLVNDRKLNYLGFSYGTFLGATYASLFPNNFRALVLDGPVDAGAYLADPLSGSNEQTSAFERELGRFFQACAADQAACSGFGGSDPWDAYDQLIDAANAKPIPAPGYTPDPRPVDGDDINGVSVVAMYAKQNWGVLGFALAQAAAGDGTLIRALVDESFYGRNPDDGTFDPGADRFFTIYGGEAHWPRDVGTYLREGNQAWGAYDHFYFNHGYSELNWGLYPVRADDAFEGPFRIRNSAPTPLEVATTYDPATPGPTARVTLNAMLLSATARAASFRGTLVNTSVLRSVRSNAAPTPASSEKTKKCQTRTISSASSTASATDITHSSIWLAASACLRSSRSATMPVTGASSSIGIARTPSTAPRRVPDPVSAYTTQPSVACWIHWAPVAKKVPAHSQRKSRCRNALKVEAKPAKN